MEGRASSRSERTPRTEGKKVFRQIGFSVRDFDTLKDLQRSWGAETNYEVLSRLLWEAELKHLKKDETDRTEITGA